MEITTEQEKIPDNIELSETGTAPAKPSLEVKGKHIRAPKQVAKRAKVAFYHFNGCAGCHVYQTVTPINYDKLNGRRTP